VRFRSWLLSIVVNQCRSWSVRQRRRTPFCPLVETRSGDHIRPGDFGERSRHPPVLQTLSPALREAFLLKHVEELEYEDMARITGVGISALKMRVKRAADALAERLTEAGDD
jgi:RNA polymerase sigma-70 factor (ECF subfamily)